MDSEVSYGGVVIRGDEVAVIVPRGRRWMLALPKGGPYPGESAQEAAQREVREETGLEVHVGDPLGHVDYIYYRDGRPIAKTVRFFLCEHLHGDFSDHDDEVEEARWMPLTTAVELLTHPGDREMVERALSLLAANG